MGWDYLQYVRGLTRLGHSVYFAEDSGQTEVMNNQSNSLAWTQDDEILGGQIAYLNTLRTSAEVCNEEQHTEF